MAASIAWKGDVMPGAPHFLLTACGFCYGRMVWVIIAGLLLTVVDMLYFWLTGAYTLRTALPPIRYQCRAR